MKTEEISKEETPEFIKKLGDYVMATAVTVAENAFLHGWNECASSLCADQSKWVKSSDRLPTENVSVLVFIPEEDHHITTGMWDVSKEWVLLDEYRIPISQVTYWMPMVPEPEDKSYVKSPHRPQEEDTMSHQILTLQKENYDLKLKCAELNASKNVTDPETYTLQFVQWLIGSDKKAVDAMYKRWKYELSLSPSPVVEQTKE